MHAKLTAIKNSAFFKHVSTLVGGTAIAQLVNFGLYYFIAQLYSPGDFGIFSIISTASSILAIMASGRYDVAIMLPEDDQKAEKLFRTAIYNGILFSAALFLLLFIVKLFLYLIFPQQFSLLPTYYLWVPLLVLAISSFQTTSILLSRKKAYAVIASSRIINTSANGSIALLLGYLQVGYFGLVIGFFFSYVAGWLVIFKQLKSSLLPLKALLDRRSHWKLAKEYKQFPLFNVPQALLDALQFNLLLLLFNRYFNVDQVGQVAFALRILQVPVSFIGAAISQVFYQQVAEKKRDGQSIYPITLRITGICFALFLPVWILFFFKGEWVFTLVFKAKWAVAGQIASILVTWIYFDFIRSPISQLAVTLNKQRTWLLLSFCLNACIYSTLLIAYKSNFEFMQVLKYTVICASICIVFLISWILILSKKLHHE
jgi:O-antigen/teichoic acid export membrane protein